MLYCTVGCSSSATVHYSTYEYSYRFRAPVPSSLPCSPYLKPCSSPAQALSQLSQEWFSLNFHLPAPEATSRSKLTKVNTLERPKQVRTWTRQSGTAPGSQAATAPPELHDDLVGEDFSCLKYSGNSGNPIIRAETLLYPPRRLQGTTPWTRAAIRG